MMNHLQILARLGKWKVALLSTSSAGIGYLIAARGGPIELCILLVGVFFLAMGASALNQVQERGVDSRMVRTRVRPIPSGEITARGALFMASIMLFMGFLILLALDRSAVLWGAFTVVWYNLVYTPLKRVTAFAAVPGAIVGALPPVIGWVVGGGSVLDREIAGLSLFFFIWQVPHFWLLVLSHGKEYENAGYPSLTKVFSTEQLSRVTFVWIVSAAVASVVLVLFGVVSRTVILLGLLAAGFWIIWKSKEILYVHGKTSSYTCAFKKVNIYVVFVMSLLALQVVFTWFGGR
jgi:protoheme IX farnesyltransferase